MVMKISLIPLLGATIALSLAAQTKPEPPPLDPAVLARLEGTMALCAKTDIQSADKYKEGAKLLTKDQPAKVVEDARKSKEYKDALDDTNKQLAKIPPDVAAKACSGFLEGK